MPFLIKNYTHYRNPEWQDVPLSKNAFFLTSWQYLPGNLNTCARATHQTYKNLDNRALEFVLSYLGNPDDQHENYLV